MFWALKGATVSPPFARMRQIPAAMVDFPTSDPVPNTAIDDTGGDDDGIFVLYDERETM